MRAKAFCVTKKKNRLKGGITLSVWGIAGLMMALTVITVALSFFLASYGIAMEQSLLAGCLLASALGIWLAARTGNRALRNAMLFFRDEEDHLYVQDVRQLAGYRRGILGYAQMEREMGRRREEVLRQFEKSGVPPVGAAEILKVDSIREQGQGYALVCRVRYGHGAVGKHTCFLVKGEPFERELLWELERRKDWHPAVELEEDRRPVYILASLAVFFIITGICIMSHPAVALLPIGIYFPCLGLDFIAVWVLVYLIAKWRRGE